MKTKIFQLKRKGYEMKIEVQGKITEEGTGMHHADLVELWGRTAIAVGVASQH